MNKKRFSKTFKLDKSKTLKQNKKADKKWAKYEMVRFLINKEFLLVNMQNIHISLKLRGKEYIDKL